MLLEFSVKNYRSIADEQKLSMVAGTSAGRRENISMETGNSFASHALKSATLLGPNASGKTSIIKALHFYMKYISISAKNLTEGDLIDVTPFKFDSELAQSPSKFEAIFVHDDALYQYGFTVDSERVWAEWLFSRPNKTGTRMRELFQREYDSEKEEYTWVINERIVTGERETWKSSTRSNALFLSTAIQLNSKSLKPPFEWAANKLIVIGSPKDVPHRFTAEKCLDKGYKEKFLAFLQSTGISIFDLEVQKEEVNFPKELEDVIRASALEEMRKNSPQFNHNVKTFHKTLDGQLISLNLNEESDGSRILFNLAWPWLDVLETGSTLIVDELHNSLHPLALKHIVSMFHDPILNKNGAQLIFTSHETSVMADKFMHKDQIWFLEKNKNEATLLYPLSDFDDRGVKAFQKAYMNGRYGALPMIKDYVHGET